MAKKTKVITQLEELAIEKKCDFLTNSILKLLEISKLKGHDLIAILITILVEVIYSTGSKRNMEEWKNISGRISSDILEGLKMYDNMEKEGTEDEQGKNA